MGHVYSQEFKEQVVEMWRESGRSMKDIATEVGVAESSVQNWVRQAQLDTGERGDGLTSAEKQELHELRRKVKQQQREIEVLGKAVAFFARNAEL